LGLQRLEESLVEAIDKVVHDQESRSSDIEKRLDNLTDIENRLDNLTDITVKSSRSVVEHCGIIEKLDLKINTLHESLKKHDQHLQDTEQKLNQIMEMLTNLKVENTVKTTNDQDTSHDDRRAFNAHKLSPSRSHDVQTSVLLLGTSNFKKIKEQKLTAFANVSKFLAYTLDEISTM
jgi:chromosome segregation ATPase